MASLSDEERTAFIEKMGSELAPLLKRSVIPIFGEQKGAAIQCGTGTLFRVADLSFLVTAAHIADLKTKHKIQLYIADGAQGALGIPLEGTLHAESKLDVAVLELPKSIVTQLPNRQFLTVHHADRANQRATRGWYYIHGYPNCWSQPIPDEQKTTVKNFTFGTVLYEGDTTNLVGYDPEVHVLLEVPQTKGIDPQGREWQLPNDLGGISGCSLWQAYYEGLPSKDWKPDDATIVAVQTGTYLRGTVVKGTRWWVPNAIICKRYPQLEQALSLVTPHKRIIRL